MSNITGKPCEICGSLEYEQIRPYETICKICGSIYIGTEKIIKKNLAMKNFVVDRLGATKGEWDVRKDCQITYWKSLCSNETRGINDIDKALIDSSKEMFEVIYNILVGRKIYGSTEIEALLEKVVKRSWEEIKNILAKAGRLSEERED